MKKIFTIWVSFAILSFANSLVQTYRQKGLKAVGEQIEFLLQDSTYWKEFLKDKNVQKGFYEFDTPIIFIDKSLKMMDLYHYKNYKLFPTSTQDIITGKMGDKQKEGDLKTPVGVYNITKRFVPQDGYYGPISFALSYPNVLDRLENKSGYGIWIHGFPLNNEKRPDQTKGCVALENKALKKFDKDLNSDKAVVIISERGDKNVSKKDIANILASLFQWKYAWKHSHLKQYLSFYDESFKRFDGKNLAQFTELKTRIFARNENKTIIFKNISISPHPDLKNKNLYRISFEELYRTNSYSFIGQKELYVKVQNNKMKIIVEK